MSDSDFVAIIQNIKLCNIHSAEVSILILIMLYISVLLTGYSLQLYTRPVTRAPDISISMFVVSWAVILVALSMVIWNKGDQAVQLFRYTICFILVSNAITVFLQLCASFISHKIKMTSIE